MPFGDTLQKSPRVSRPADSGAFVILGCINSNTAQNFYIQLTATCHF